MDILLDTNVLINWLVEENKKHVEASRLILSCLMDGIEEGHLVIPAEKKKMLDNGHPKKYGRTAKTI